MSVSKKHFLILAGSILFLSGVVFANTFTGDGINIVSINDIVLANNGYGFKITEITPTMLKAAFRFPDGLLTWTAELGLGKSGKYTASATGVGNYILNLTVNSISGSTTSVSLQSINESQENPDIPSIETPSNGNTTGSTMTATYKGDGTYTLKSGESVASDRGYVIEFTGKDIATDGTGITRAYAGVVVYNKSGQTIIPRLSLDAQGESGNLRDLGLTVLIISLNEAANEVDLKVLSGVTVTLYPGWNLFSAPLFWNVALDSSCPKGTCFGPGPYGLQILENTCGNIQNLKILHWDAEEGKYIKSLPYNPRGHWLKVENKCSITFGRDVSPMNIRALFKGWNQIAGPSFSNPIVYFDDVKGDCEVLSGPWSYNRDQKKYELSPVVAAGEGYFVKVANDCSLG